jgi:hypothetical protein
VSAAEAFRRIKWRKLHSGRNWDVSGSGTDADRPNADAVEAKDHAVELQPVPLLPARIPPIFRCGPIFPNNATVNADEADEEVDWPVLSIAGAFDCALMRWVAVEVATTASSD